MTKREDPIDDTPLEYMQIYQKCWKTDPNLRPGINEVHEILTQLKIKQFKLNHGLRIIDHDNNIKISVQPVTVEHGKLIRSLYDGQPFVYTGINSIMTSTLIFLWL